MGAWKSFHVVVLLSGGASGCAGLWGFDPLSNADAGPSSEADAGQPDGAAEGGPAATPPNPPPMADASDAPSTGDSSPPPALASAIGAGGPHTCVVTTGGAVECWGHNEHGQLGNNSTQFSASPVVAVSSGVQSIALGELHTCALTTAGGVLCWGDNSLGQLGSGAPQDSIVAVPAAVPGLGSGVASLAAGGSHTCALTTEGAVECWGENTFGELGNGSVGFGPAADGGPAGSPAPLPVLGLGSSATAVAVGGHHTCALTGGTVQCWGENNDGQLGNGNPDGPTPSVVVEQDGTTPLQGVLQIAAGVEHTCALTNGEVQCWGLNNHGQLGNGSAPTGTSVPSPVVDGTGTSISGVSVLGAGDLDACGLTPGGSLLCWGFNLYGQLGNQSTADSPVAVAALNLPSDVSAIAVGLWHTCALTSSGHALCWGVNGAGELGSGSASNTPSLTPVGVSGFSGP